MIEGYLKEYPFIEELKEISLKRKKDVRYSYSYFDVPRTDQCYPQVDIHFSAINSKTNITISMCYPLFRKLSMKKFNKVASIYLMSHRRHEVSIKIDKKIMNVNSHSLPQYKFYVYAYCNQCYLWHQSMTACDATFEDIKS
jgi:hypothetical protein